MKRKLLFQLPALLAAVLLFVLWPSDEKKIRHNLELLADYCTTASGETGVAWLQKAALAGKLCSEPCRVDVESFAIAKDFNKRELRDHIVMMKKNLPGISFSFQDTQVEVSGDRAGIVTTLSLSGKIGDDRVADAYELKIDAVKRDGDWLFSAFTVVEFMER